MDTQKSPEMISGKMTGALCIYAATFMRYSLAIKPKNYLLFLCHSANAGAQLTQGYRYLQYHHWGGKEKTGGTYAVDAAKKKIAKVENKANDTHCSHGTEDKVFARLLQVDTAYHSHHMLHCAGSYMASAPAVSAARLRIAEPTGADADIEAVSPSNKSANGAKECQLKEVSSQLVNTNGV
ncbi:hypothetical protein CNMCM6069_001146 [Aspergillus lentulus]|nr:hypothetical protein CNMCM6069_001146 [Aspergillus lentulus]